MLQFQSDRFQLLRNYRELAVVIVTLQLKQKKKRWSVAISLVSDI